MHPLNLFSGLFTVSFLFRFISAIPWVANEQARLDQNGHLPSSSISPSDLLQSGAKRSALFQLALTELQELEAEPLCHRVAARLLVNNCQLLEGKDDATVLTDSGRRARDFVDSYAASLAICDLERASFNIPPACEPFREPTLSQIPLSDTAQLHVPETQIRACLAGLGESPSAWNTWVSYSHKALRFCEAARADHEKTQNILVFQKLTRVMAKLTDDVEAELQKRMETWDTAAQDAAERLGRIVPMADSLWERMTDMEALFQNSIVQSVAEMSTATGEGAESARALQQLLGILVKTVLESNSELAFAHELSIEKVKERTGSEIEVINAVMQGAFASAVSLQNQLEYSQFQTADLASRQEALEKGMVHLEGMAQTFFSNFDTHTRLLVQANNMTVDMLDTLEATAAATSTIQNSFLRNYGDLGGWWPYIVCPVVSLVTGSYGLPPSILRNIGLFTLGEIVGATISFHNHLGTMVGVLFAFTGMVNNTTVTAL